MSIELLEVVQAEAASEMLVKQAQEYKERAIKQAQEEQERVLANIRPPPVNVPKSSLIKPNLKRLKDLATKNKTAAINRIIAVIRAT